MKTLNLALFVSMTLLLFSCEVQKVKRTQHDPEVKTARELPADKPASTADFEKIDLNKIHGLLTGKTNTASKNTSAESIVNELGPIVLNNNYIQNPSFLASKKTRVMLSYFNAALLELLKLNSSKAQVYLDKYQEVITDGCDENLKGCRNLNFFRQDQRSSSILVQIVKSIDAEIDALDKSQESKENSAKNLKVKKYFKLLALAFEVKNVVKDHDLEFLYLKRARDYADYFRQMQDDEKSANAELLRRHGAVFENIVNSFPANVKDPKFKNFVLKFNPWTYSRLEKDDPFPFGTQRMFSYAANNYMYEGNKLSADFIRAINDVKTKEDRFGASFQQIVNKIKNESGVPFIFKALQTDISALEESSFYDEYFFMIDRLYRGHLSTQEVGEIWKGSRQNVDQLMNRLELYMKIQVLDLITATNKYMADIIAEPDMNSENLIRQTIERSKFISDKWRDMLARLNGPISTFLGQSLRHSAAAEKALADANEIIDTIPRSIKYLSVYPNMFLLTYYIQDLQAKLTINSFFGSFSIDPKDIIEALFKGQIAPWFSFGNDHYALNKLEILYAYYYALNTGTFETFGKLKNKQDGTDSVDRKLFFQKVVRQYLSSDKNRLEEALRSYSRIQNDNEYYNMIQYCDRIRRKDLNFTVNLSLNEFDSFTVFGSPKSGGIKSLINVYKMSDYGPDYLFGNYLRASLSGRGAEGLETKLLFLQSMVQILVNNMENLGFTSDEVQAIKTVTDTEVASIEGLMRAYHDEVIKYHKQASDCVYETLSFERQRQIELLNREKENLAKVYDLMIELRQLPQDQVKAKVIEASGQLGLIEGLDRVSGDIYSYNRLNAQLRMKTYSEEMQPKVVVSLPSEYMRESAAQQFRTLSITDSRGQVIPKETFVRSAMSYYGRNTGAFVSWIDEMSEIRPLLNKITGMGELYRFAKSKNIAEDVTISAEELVNESFKILDFIGIKKNEADIFRIIGNDTKVDIDDLNQLLLTDSLEPRGLLDFLSERLADLSAVFYEGNELYLTTVNRGKFLFKMDPKVDTAIRDLYVPFVQKNEKLVRDFISKVDQMESSLGEKQTTVSVVYRLDAKGDRVFDLKDTSYNKQQVRLISPNRREDIEARFNEFHNRKTNRYFLRSPQ